MGSRFFLTNVRASFCIVFQVGKRANTMKGKRFSGEQTAVVVVRQAGLRMSLVESISKLELTEWNQAILPQTDCGRMREETPGSDAVTSTYQL